MVCEDSGPKEILIFFVSEAALCEDRCFFSPCCTQQGRFRVSLFGA